MRLDTYAGLVCALSVTLAHHTQTLAIDEPSLGRLATAALSTGPANQVELPTSELTEPADHNVDAALNDILGDDILQQNVAKVRDDAKRLPLAERYQLLSDWVLPGKTHSQFRLSMSFAPEGAVGESINGELQSPAMDLVEVAALLGRLDDLRARVSESAPTSNRASRCRNTLLVLIDIAAGKFVDAEQRLGQLHSDFLQLNRDEVTTRFPETLAIVAAARHEETRETAAEFLAHIVDSFIRKDRSGSTDVWDRQMAALAGATKPAIDSSEIPDGIASKRWTPVSRRTAMTNGLGYPAGDWHVQRGHVKNVASHNEDYLYYNIPLRGNFEVECDVTSFGWRHSHLFIGGEWVAPVWGNTTYQVGNFRQAQPFIALNPPLQEPGSWMRYRVVVRDGVASTYFNGRRVHTRTLDPHHEPWVAIRSPWYAAGEVKDLRISGHPEIPLTLKLSEARGLPGWISFYDETDGTDWKQVSQAAHSQVIVGTRREDLAGTHKESLLQYNRPMLEDGTIAYEFFYREGSTHVHPAIGNVAFLISPDGIRVHRMTTGCFDVSAGAPGRSIIPDLPAAISRVPLKEDRWNKMSLNLVGDTVQLTLHGEKIITHELSSDTPRTFGLFHYSDQTEACVRSVIWTGDWPDSIPPPEKQELAAPDPLYPELVLKETFHHDFGTAAMPATLWSQGNFDEANVKSQITPQGLRIQHQSSDGYRQCYATPSLKLDGDFDIVATFTDLKTTPSRNGTGGIAIDVVMADPAATHCSVYRGQVRRPAEEDQQTSHLYIHRTIGPDAQRLWLGNIVEACDSGRLRLIRHGSTLYSLIAEHDSPNFRLVSTEEVATDSSILDGIRLRVLTESGSTDVVWKSIDIRADRLRGPATEDTVELLAELNRQRDGLAQSWNHDFRKLAPAAADFSQIGAAQKWKAADGGLLITADGSNAWLTDGFRVKRAIVGDFNISTEFDVLDLPTPAPAARLSSVYLQMQFRDDKQSRPTLVFHKNESGATTIVAELWVPSPNGGMQFQTLNKVAVDSVEGLRFARRQNELFYVVTSSQFVRDRVIARVAVPSVPIFPGDVAFQVHAGGTGLQAKVLSTSIEIRADEVRHTLTPEQRKSLTSAPVD